MHRFLAVLLLAACHLGAADQPAPAATAPAPVPTVSVGVFVTSLYNIDFTSSQFTGQFWVWFVGAPKEFKPATGVEVVNAKTQRVLASSHADTPQGTWDQLKIEAQVHQRWDISAYPFDRQVLVFNLESTDLDRSRLQFVPDVAGSRRSPEIALDGWRIEDFRIRGEDQTYPTSYGDPTAGAAERSTFSRVVVEVELKREGWRLLFYTFLGFVLAIVLSSMVLTMNTTDYLVKTVPLAIRMTISTGALFATVGAAYTLQSRLPTTTAFTLADAIQGTAFIGTMCAVLASLGSETLVTNGDRTRGLRLGRILFGLFAALLLADVVLVLRAVAS